jgi:hypothetical protein
MIGSDPFIPKTHQLRRRTVENTGTFSANSVKLQTFISFNVSIRIASSVAAVAVVIAASAVEYTLLVTRGLPILVFPLASCIFAVISGVLSIERVTGPAPNEDSPECDHIGAAAVIAGALAILWNLLAVGALITDHANRPTAFIERDAMHGSLLPFSETLLLTVYIVCVLRLPKGNWPTRRKLAEDEELKRSVDKLKTELTTEEINALQAHQALSRPDENQFASIRDKVLQAIDYAIKRHDWYEDQRFRIFQIVLGVATLALTFAGFFLKSPPNSSEFYWAFGGLLVFIFVAIVRGVLLYNRELDADRPYRSIADIRFWFFRYNLPQHSSGDAPPKLLARVRSVADERRRFFKRILDTLDPYHSMREDLEQLFILQVLQRHKTESLRRLRWLLGYTVILLPVQFAICFWAESLLRCK